MMDVLVANECSFQSEAIGYYLGCHNGCCQVVKVKSVDEFIGMQRSQSASAMIVSMNLWVQIIEIFHRENRKRCWPTESVHIILIERISPSEIASSMGFKPACYLHLNDATNYLLNKYHLLAQNNDWLSPTLSAAIGHTPQKDDPILFLSHFELLILYYVLQNKSTKDIAGITSKSPLTIEGYRKKIKEKMSVRGGKKSLVECAFPYLYWICKRAFGTYNSTLN